MVKLGDDARRELAHQIAESMQTIKIRLDELYYRSDIVPPNFSYRSWIADMMLLVVIDQINEDDDDLEEEDDDKLAEQFTPAEVLAHILMTNQDLDPDPNGGTWERIREEAFSIYDQMLNKHKNTTAKD